MPRIPIYEQPQVANRQAPGVMMPNAPAGAFGEGVAAGLHNLGGVVGEVALKAKQEEEQNIYHGATNKVLAIDEETTTQAQKLKGEEFTKPDEQGKFASDKLIEDRNARIEALTRDLPAKVKQQVLLAADRSRVTVQRNLDTHLVQQSELVKRANADAAVEGLNTYAASHPFDEQGYQDRLGNALAAIAPRFQGLPDARRQAEASLVANALVARARGMIESSPDDAKKFFDANAEAMSASVHFMETKKIIDGQVNFAAAKGMTDEFIGKATQMKVDPESGIGTYDWFGARRELEDAIKGKPKEFRDQALHMFDSNQTEWTKQRAIKIDSAQAVVSKIAGQKGASAALGSKELASMIANPDTSEAGFALKKSLMAWQHQLANQSKENMSGQYAVNILPFLMDKTLLANLTPDKVANLLPQVGPHGVQLLGSMVGALEQTNTVPIPPDLLKSVMSKTTYNMKDPATADMVNRAYSAANDELVQAKKAGQKIDRNLIESTLKSNLAAFETVTKERSLWFDKTGQVPWGGMTDQQKVEAIKLLPKEEVSSFANYAKVRYGVSTFSSQDAYMKAFSAWRAQGKPSVPNPDATTASPAVLKRPAGGYR